MNDCDMVSVREILRSVAARLEKAGIANAGGEAEMILMFLTGHSRAGLHMAENVEVSRERLENILRRRCLREPLQYIAGEAYFMNLKLHVEPGVLIPRPETEILVERICRAAPPHGRICDVGTGSGAIALSVARERPDLEITAVDISADACRIAEANKFRLRLEHVRVLHSDLLESVTGRFDVIAANLPYIAVDEYAGLQPEVRDYEPVSALISGHDGLDLIRRLIAEAPDYLSSRGFLMLEIGAGQGAAVAALMAAGYTGVEIIRDYNGLERHVVGVSR